MVTFSLELKGIAFECSLLFMQRGVVGWWIL